MPKTNNISDKKVEESINSIETKTENNSLSVEDLQKKIDELTKIVMQLGGGVNTAIATPTITDDDIVIVSLYDGVLNLTGSVPISFNEFGEKRIISRHNINEYIASNMEFFKRGYFYVNCPDIIKKYGYSELYDKLLTDTVIKNISNYNTSDITALVENAPETQQQILCDILVSKCLKDESLDYNKLNIIDKCCGNTGENTILRRVENRRRNLEKE